MVLRASNFLQKRLKDLRLDPTVYGHGCGGGKGARYANPRDQAPAITNRYTGRREYRRLGKSQIKQHIAGKRPFFGVNVANMFNETWDIPGLLTLLGEAYEAAGTDRTDSEDAFLKAMAGPRPPLSIAQARKLLIGKSGKKSFFGDTCLALLGQRILQGDRLIRRLLERAIKVELLDVRIHELGVDIDGEAGLQIAPAHARALGEKLIREFFGPLGIVCFLEPSRSRTGAYVRFTIRRESDDPAAFFEMIKALTGYLKAIPTEGLAAKVCKVGGRPAAWKPNPAFSQEAFDAPQWDGAGPAIMTLGENYLWRKHHADMTLKGGLVKWAYVPQFERYVIEGIDQLTLPLHHLAADEDGGAARLHAYESFVSMEPAAESTLRKALGMPPANQAPVTMEKVVVGTVSPVDEIAAVHLHDDGDRDKIRADLLRVYGPSEDVAIFLDPEAVEHARFGAASRMAVRRNQAQDKERIVAESLDLAELGGATGDIGPATGPRTSEREDHMTRCADHWIDKYDASKRGSGASAPMETLWGDDEARAMQWARRRVRKRISRGRIDRFQKLYPRSYRITREMLACGLIFSINGIHTDNLRHLPRNYIQNRLEERGLPHTYSTVACLMAILRDPKVGLLRLMKREKRKSCRHYVLRRNCPIPSWLLEADVAIQMEDAPPASQLAKPVNRGWGAAETTPTYPPPGQDMGCVEMIEGDSWDDEVGAYLGVSEDFDPENAESWPPTGE